MIIFLHEPLISTVRVLIDRGEKLLTAVPDNASGVDRTQLNLTDPICTQAVVSAALGCRTC